MKKYHVIRAYFPIDDRGRAAIQDDLNKEAAQGWQIAQVLFAKDTLLLFMEMELPLSVTFQKSESFNIADLKGKEAA